MKKYIDCSKVRIDKCEYGLGVFADVDIIKGEIIEVGIVYVLTDVDGDKEGNEHLHTWSDDRTKWAAPSGCIPWYNHSDNPNIKKVGDLKNNTLNIVALRDIKKGEELRNKYFSAKWRKCFRKLKS
jgi:hypothetical protein